MIGCASAPDGFEADVRFQDKEDAFGRRIWERICHIESHRQQVSSREGRVLAPEPAAA